jgi:epoxyqueuosine reductase
MGDWVFGCDVCQEVCPWNRARVAATHEEFTSGAGAGPTLNLVELLRLDDASFRDRFGGTALTRPKRAGLLRNAAVAAGNIGDRTAIPALVEALADEAALVRGHAAWALGQLAPLSADALGALRGALSVESSPEVRAELIDVLSDSC